MSRIWRWAADSLKWLARISVVFALGVGSLFLAYKLGESAGRAKEVASPLINEVAQDYFERGYWEGIFKGVDRATVREANKT